MLGEPNPYLWGRAHNLNPVRHDFVRITMVYRVYRVG
jgi:hypothetical protein